jgi:hypothetical protein
MCASAFVGVNMCVSVCAFVRNGCTLCLRLDESLYAIPCLIMINRLFFGRNRVCSRIDRGRDTATNHGVGNVQTDDAHGHLRPHCQSSDPTPSHGSAIDLRQYSQYSHLTFRRGSVDSVDRLDEQYGEQRHCGDAMRTQCQCHVHVLLSCFEILLSRDKGGPIALTSMRTIGLADCRRHDTMLSSPAHAPMHVGGSRTTACSCLDRVSLSCVFRRFDVGAVSCYIIDDASSDCHTRPRPFAFLCSYRVFKRVYSSRRRTDC